MMAEICTSCGVELATGQRFCRFCGKQTAQFPEDRIPTQYMPPAPTTAPRSAATTAPPSRPGTNPVYNPQPSFYQPQVPAVPYAPYTPPRKGPVLGLILGFIALGVLGVIVLAVMFATRSSRLGPGRILPPPLPIERAGEFTIGEGNPQSFAFTSSSNLTLTNINGDIVIDSWDEPRAELTVTKRGGSARDRAATRVILAAQGDNVTLRTDPTRGRNVTVEYELKLPRHVGRIDISSVNSKVTVSDISGQVSIKTTNGSIKLSDISGRILAEITNGNIDLTGVSAAATTKTDNGSTSVEVGVIKEGEPLEFSSLNGNIKVRLDSEINADLDAKTDTGTIDLDRDLGIQVERRMIGARASGKIGNGGQPLTLKTFSGSIKVTR